MTDANQDKKGLKRLMRFLPLFALSAIVIGSIVAGTRVFSESPKALVATPNAMPTPQKNKKYIATREITVDKQTGQVRKPTDDELSQLVSSLSEMLGQPTDNLPTRPLSNGGEMVQLDGALAPVAIARPRPDGSMEVKCVTSMDEAAEFLGLVEDDTQ
jgi:hypothetical protein